MVTLTRDHKSSMYVLTTTDGEGFHRQIYLTAQELRELKNQMPDD